MRATVTLNWDELEVLHRLAGVVLSTGRAGTDRKPLRSAMRKLTAAAKEVLCDHCGHRPSRRKNKLCDRCHTYQETYGRLPSLETIKATAERRQVG